MSLEGRSRPIVVVSLDVPPPPREPEPPAAREPAEPARAPEPTAAR